MGEVIIKKFYFWDLTVEGEIMEHYKHTGIIKEIGIFQNPAYCVQLVG
jgi:hypothetical protein